MPIGTLLIFSLFANNVRTAGLIGIGDALIDVFDLGKVTVPVENRSVALSHLQQPRLRRNHIQQPLKTT